MIDGDRSLEELLREVSQASPNDRIDLRDDVARWGLTAIDALSDWLSDPELCRFALRTIGRAGQFERDAAIRTLISGREMVSPSIRDDIDVELLRLDYKAPKPRKPSLPSWARTDPYDVAPISPELA